MMDLMSPVSKYETFYERKTLTQKHFQKEDQDWGRSDTEEQLLET